MASRNAMLPFKIEVTDDEDSVTAHAGLPLVVETMRKLGVSRELEGLGLRQRNNGSTDAQKCEAIVMLMAAGGECIRDINVLRADTGLGKLLDAPLPTEDVLWSFLQRFHDPRLIDEAKQKRRHGQVAYIPEESKPLSHLGHVNRALARTVAAHNKITRATLDHDATILESHKKLAMAHYKDGKGYQPAVIYWTEADQIIGDEYRDGNVPAGMENLRLIKMGFQALPDSVQSRALRGDSALYEEKVLKWLADSEREDGPKGFIGFTISADMTRELSAACDAVAGDAWAFVEERPSETVFCAEVEFAPGNWPRDAKPLRYVAVRFRGKQLDIEGAVRVKTLAIVSNRTDLAAINLLRWHWQKAGTIEHVHHVVKNQLGAATPPCAHFGANAAWFRFALLTYNVLSAMKQLALPPSLDAAQPKRLRFALLSLPGRIVRHAGTIALRIARAANALADLFESRARLALLPHAPA